MARDGEEARAGAANNGGCTGATKCGGPANGPKARLGTKDLVDANSANVGCDVTQRCTG
jgi:hypothetical protein